MNVIPETSLYEH